MFKNLKSLFIVEEETDKNTEKEAKKDVEKNTTVENNKNVVVQKVDATASTHSYSTSTHNIDQRIWDSLLKALEKNNLEGFDYLEFKNSLVALQAMPMDEATRFKSAFATASTMGVTLEKLTQSVEHYKNVLKKEKADFDEALKMKIDENVVTKEKLISQLQEEINKKNQLIKTLTDEIEAHKNEMIQAQAHINEVTQKIELTKNNFEYTFNALMSQINDDLNKMNTYLK
ncbi:MAG: hypothetical protein NZ529_04270 [Cytophagaceae bacterium]|nr:hypothetical protein [Cytophagaceae bacterium]MDW8455989.1 hypothetical protein [Cytophagaceae bacterium]